MSSVALRKQWSTFLLLCISFSHCISACLCLSVYLSVSVYLSNIALSSALSLSLSLSLSHTHTYIHVHGPYASIVAVNEFGWYCFRAWPFTFDGEGKDFLFRTEYFFFMHFQSQTIFFQAYPRAFFHQGESHISFSSGIWDRKFIFKKNSPLSKLNGSPLTGWCLQYRLKKGPSDYGTVVPPVYIWPLCPAIPPVVRLPKSGARSHILV